MTSQASVVVLHRRLSTLTSARVLQRACACGQQTAKGEECEECKKSKSTLQRQASVKIAAPTAPATVHDVLHSNGRPLDQPVRSFMEPSFGYDFSRVRIHTDDQAGESARAVNALAYTVGQNIVFDTGQYQPNTLAGKHLLAHELTHVIQQDRTAGASMRHLKVGPSDDPMEREAHSVADSIVSGLRANPARTSDLMVRRQGPGAATATPTKAMPAAGGGSLCSIYGDERALSKNHGFCKDTPGTGKLHHGFTCFREVPTSSGCPPGKHICFKDGKCSSSETHVDSTAPSLKRRADGFCDVSYLGLCSILHGIKDVVPWKTVGITGAGIAIGAGFGATAGGGLGAAIGAGVGALAGGILSGAV